MGGANASRVSLVMEFKDHASGLEWGSSASSTCVLGTQETSESAGIRHKVAHGRVRTTKHSLGESRHSSYSCRYPAYTSYPCRKNSQRCGVPSEIDLDTSYPKS